MKMPGLMKSAKLKAIMDIISQMDDMEMDRLMPKDKMDMEYNEEIKPEKKGLTIVKLESDKKPMMEMEEEDDSEKMEDDDEEVDPYSVLGRLKAKMKMKKSM
jgi:hypothetical protein